MLTPAKAYDIASQWVSYRHAGDPGACFYGFYFRDGRPVSDPHRTRCLKYTAALLGVEHGRPITLRRKRDIDQLRKLYQFFSFAPLYREAA